MLVYDDYVVRSVARCYDGRVNEVLCSTMRPGRRLYVRVNMLRADPGAVLDSLRSKGFEVYRDEVAEEALWFPIKGPFKVRLHDKVVVVDKRAAESVMMGADVYVPGVIYARGVKRGDEVSVVSPTGLVVAEGIAERDYEELANARRGLFVRTVRSLYLAPSLRGLPEREVGLLYEQSLPAMLASKILNPKPGELVVDMCAAPGGKTGHLVELSRGHARIYAFDHSQSRIRRMLENLEVLGHRGRVVARRADSRYLDLDFPELVGKTDKVLLDPPCTALGVRPKVYDVKGKGDVLSSARYQEQFLRVAYKLLKPGGIMVYSTCTLTVDENEDIVAKAVKLGFEVVEPPSTFARIASKGAACYDFYDCVLRFDPSLDLTPGFFIAVLRKPS